MYRFNPGSGRLAGPRVSVPSAASWRRLQLKNSSLGRSVGRSAPPVPVRIGGSVVMLPPYYRMAGLRGLGDNGSDLSSIDDPFGAGAAGGASSALLNYSGADFESTPGLDFGSSLLPQSNLNTLYPVTSTGQFIVPISQEQPAALIAAETPSATIPLSQALANAGLSTTVAGAAAVPGTAAYNSLLAAGLTAAQIAAMAGKSAPGAAAPAVASASIVPGVSNTALLVGGAIVLMVLASGKKR